MPSLCAPLYITPYHKEFNDKDVSEGLRERDFCLLIVDVFSPLKKKYLGFWEAVLPVAALFQILTIYRLLPQLRSLTILWCASFWGDVRESFMRLKIC